MKFAIPIDLSGLGAYLPRFVGLIGLAAWEKRAKRLIADASDTPAISKITQDFHWLELELAHLRRRRRTLGRIPAQIEAAQTRPALHFAAAVVEIHRRLSRDGGRLFQGRLRAALTAETGFSPLYLEVSIATTLMTEGFDVEFADVERQANYDFLVRRNDVVCEVECKSISSDAGRKIHRKDFYRFMATVTSEVEKSANTADTDDAIVITVSDRLPAGTAEHRELHAAVTAILTHGLEEPVNGSCFSIHRAAYSDHFGSMKVSNDSEFQAKCRAAYGDNCHVFGATGSGGTCLLVMRSRRQDDHSRPLLKAMGHAVTQLSGMNAGFICVQFDDIAASDLTTTHLRRRMELFSQYVFGKSGAEHVAATYFTGYSIATSITPHDLGSAAVCFWNPTSSHLDKLDMPFRSHIPDAKFAELCALSDRGQLPIEGRGAIPSSKSWRRSRR